MMMMMEIINAHDDNGHDDNYNLEEDDDMMRMIYIYVNMVNI